MKYFWVSRATVPLRIICTQTAIFHASYIEFAAVKEIFISLIEKLLAGPSNKKFPLSEAEIVDVSDFN